MAERDTAMLPNGIEQSEELAATKDIENVSGATTVVAEDAGEGDSADMQDETSKLHETKKLMPENVSSNIMNALNKMLPPEKRAKIVDWARENPKLAILILPQVALTAVPLILLFLSITSFLVLSTTLALLLAVLSITIPMLVFATFAVFIITPIVFLAATGAGWLSLSGFVIYKTAMQYSKMAPRSEKSSVPQDEPTALKQDEPTKQVEPEKGDIHVQQKEISRDEDSDHGNESETSPIEEERRTWKWQDKLEQASTNGDQDGIPPKVPPTIAVN